jgi:DNA-directed RNA polymerase
MKNVQLLKSSSLFATFSFFKIKRELHNYIFNKTNENIKLYNHLKRWSHSNSLVNERRKRTQIFNYLNTIKNIINNPNYKAEEAQEIIENKWIEIMSEKLNDRKFLLNSHSNKLFNLLIKGNSTLDRLYKNKTIKKKFPLLWEDLNKLEYLILSFSLSITFCEKLNYTSLMHRIGENILYFLYKNSLKGKLNSNENYNFSDWKEKFQLNNEKEKFKLGDFFINILSNSPSDIFYRDLEKKEKYNKYEPAVLRINEDYLEYIKENIIIHPSTLPMVCKPVKWSCKSFGGFLDNKNKGEGIITGSVMHNHKMENKKPLYNTINYLNSIKFSINNTLLDYLNNEGKYLLEEIKADDLLQRTITLKIAETYKNIPFYLNTHADWRGRIYTQSFFISYQAGDLSSAILNFWDGEPLTETGKYYFYIYGANNHNENDISKTSFSKRIQWVKNNYNKIISLDKEFIKKAENPFIFLSFCLIMKELFNNPNSIVKIPVFLDATCNGIQHLAAILQDIELGSKVNLTSFNEKEGPKDIYSELLDPINKAINLFGEDNLEFSILSLVKLNRRIIKQSIMTKVYNVSEYGISNQLKSKLEKIKGENCISLENISKDLKNNLTKSKEYYFCPGKNGTSINLNNRDIFKIASIINDQIFVLFPSLNSIYSYLIDVTKLIIKLGIPLTWITPAGMKITQHYLKSKQTTIAISFGGKIKKTVLREWTDIMDSRKQTQSIIPNIIHSLDANHLINLINNAIKDKFSPIITIHDCFGTHPNKMEILEYKVKKEFILLYTKNKFINTFHKRLILSIKDNQFKIIEIKDNKFVENKDKNNSLLKIPSIPKLGKLDLQKIIKSKYLIS